MKISIDWLQDYVDIDLPPDELAERLTMAGLEVEEIERSSSDFDGVLVGEVLDVRRHPNADRLTVCRVDVGQDEPLNIVCGAPNVAAGQKVPVATVGTTLTIPSNDAAKEPKRLKIKRAKLRGEVSEGMICSEDELGLSDDHSGIMVLDAATKPGLPFRRYLRDRGVAMSDVVLDIAITPNRPDATSHFGVARDVAALTGGEFRQPDLTLPLTSDSSHGGVSIRIEAPEACRRYVGLVVRDVTIRESPEWLKQRLTAVGLRPRNNVVDATNFVMYECGQPLHAFDLDSLAGPAIEVRLSKGGERFVTLDDREHTLPAETLLICDAEKPVALAGIMGGQNSEVSDATTNILIESAYFDPRTIRRAAKKLSIQTDSSYRFERGINAGAQLWAAVRAAELIAELAGGRVERKAIDAHPRPVEFRTVGVRPERANSVLGVEIEPEEMARLLRSIGFGVSSSDGVLECVVPKFRPDVEREIDLIEEIARLYGYDRIPEPPRSSVPNAVPREDASDVLRRAVRDRLAGIGFHEIHTNSMLRADTAERFNVPPLVQGVVAGIVETLNPISREMAALRPSLLPGALQVTGYNQNHGQRGLSFFEFGHVFARGDNPRNVLPGYRERDHLLVVATGDYVLPGWSEDVREADIFDIRGVVELVLDVLGVTSVEFAPVHDPSPLTTYHLALRLDGRVIGLTGRLADTIAQEYDIDTPLFFAEIEWDALSSAADTERRFIAISRYPVVERDIAVVVPRDRPAGKLLDAIRAEGGPLLQDANLFDLYEGDRVPPGTRSLAFSLRFGADRTLTDREVDERVQAITLRLKQQYDADLRH